jgi:integrase
MGVRKWTDGKGRKRYAVEFEVRGSRIFRRLPPGATKAQAEHLETRLRHDFIDQAVIGSRPNVSVETVIASWLAESVTGKKGETQTRSHAAGALRRTDGGMPFVGAIAGWAVAIREDAALSPATRNRRLCVVKAAAKFAWLKGWTAENLSARIQLLPEPKYRRREVSPEDARKLIDKASTPRAKALIALSAYTGLRLGEVLKLRPQDVRNGVIHVRDSKTGEDRFVPILDELEPHLKQLPFKAGWRNVYRGFLSARKRAGLTIRYHDLRHMVGTALTNKGIDLRLVADILGHESLQTTRGYTHPNLEVKRAALKLALSPIGIPIKRGAKKAA